MWISYREIDRINSCFMAACQSNQSSGLNAVRTAERPDMEDKRVFLVGCILQGMAQRGEIYFGMAEDALALADATLNLMAQSETTQSKE